MFIDTINAPIPVNEKDRLFALSDLDLDYDNLAGNFKDLTRLAAKVAGTDISMINLIDTYTQWTVSNFGFDLKQMPREDSVCQYTIMQHSPFEVTDLSADSRFRDKFYVTDDPKLKYYYGIPLQTSLGYQIGALCVLDPDAKEISPEQTEMLTIIANEIVNRLQSYKAIDVLKQNLHIATESQRRVAHDIRGPLSGIIGLARVISEQGEDNTIEEVLELTNLIEKSGHSLLEFADDILMADSPARQLKLGADEFNQLLLKDKLEKLYLPQAKNKNINFKVAIDAETAIVPFSKNKLLQIIGNLVSNSMKFTPEHGTVFVNLTMQIGDFQNNLHISVSDNGVGMDSAKIDELLKGKGKSTNGTCGENGFGFGLALVKHLVDTSRGEMNITSEPGLGTTFKIVLPQPKHEF